MRRRSEPSTWPRRSVGEVETTEHTENWPIPFSVFSAVQHHQPVAFYRVIIRPPCGWPAILGTADRRSTGRNVVESVGNDTRGFWRARWEDGGYDPGPENHYPEIQALYL